MANMESGKELGFGFGDEEKKRGMRWVKEREFMLTRKSEGNGEEVMRNKEIGRVTCGYGKSG